MLLPRPRAPGLCKLDFSPCIMYVYIHTRPTQPIQGTKCFHRSWDRSSCSRSLGDIVEAMTNILTPVPTSLPATLAAVVTGAQHYGHREQQSCYTSSRVEGAIDAPHHHHALHQLQA